MFSTADVSPIPLVINARKLEASFTDVIRREPEDEPLADCFKDKFGNIFDQAVNFSRTTIRKRLNDQEGNLRDQHEQATRLFAQVMDLQKGRYPLAKYPSPNSSICFTNLIRTRSNPQSHIVGQADQAGKKQRLMATIKAGCLWYCLPVSSSTRQWRTRSIHGYGVDLIFASQESDSESVPELEANDFSPWELEHIFDLWGADLVIAHTYLAVNGYNPLMIIARL